MLQHFHCCRVKPFSSQPKRSYALGSGRTRVCLGFQEALDERHLPPLGRFVQWGEAELIDLIHLSPGVQEPEHPNGWVQRAGTGQMEHGLAEPVRKVDIGMTSEEELHELHYVGVHGQVKQ